MHILGWENDPELLRELLKVVVAHNERSERNEHIEKRIRLLEGKFALKSQIELDLGAQLKLLKKIIFGKCSEKKSGRIKRQDDEVK